MASQRAGFFACCTSILVAAVVVSLALPVVSQSTIYNFKGDPDGAIAAAPLIRDSEGNLYGTTETGGINDGTVFKLSSTGKETILHAFTNSPDGASPWGGLVRDQSGNLYGTTAYGGDFNSGTVFKVTEAGEESVLYSFSGVPDGAAPYVGLVLDPEGNLYGVTLYGGSGTCTSESGQKGCGTVFEISASGAERLLYSFDGGSDGQYPNSPLVRDPSGNLYGLTQQGGPAKCSDSSSNGCGTLFKLSSNGTKTILHSFTGYPTDGENPQGITFGPGGNLFGTTAMGGAYGFGTVFKSTPSGAEKLLYSFGEFSNPNGGMVSDGSGRFYGTTVQGGGTGCAGYGCGTIFEVTGAGDEKTLAAFSEFTGGCVPFAGLIRDSAGHLYGTTTNCGTHSDGTVFAIKP